eukprot:Plantae.Rhodophyta-Hildenbrandia_rubra.ctg3461.p1 GENE.Plantae.Rhodophyta-Hildenbrandia_rubra.ctg3461~~Plantae.Rhodophyta-Hildenbrandia_rubra.ctg3461.p1  ORF type:complete len:406 (+),score=68.41 Plantae.Rhodophyta-Hildenbrandia_rubra.ctg3461:569-1786(+)
MSSPGLDSKDVQILANTLEDDTTQLSILSSSLWSSVSLAKDLFLLGTTITALLQDRLLPSRTQRIIALYLLQDIVRNKEGNAFGVVLEEIVRTGDEWEKAYIGMLAERNAAIKLKGARIVSEEINETDEKLKDAARQWVAKFVKGMSLEKYKFKAISAVILDAEEDSEKLGLAEELGNEVKLLDFIPNFPSLRPPMMEIDDDEMMWVEPEVLHEVVWDPMMGQKETRGKELKQLMAKALKWPLQQQQQQRMLSLLEADDKSVHYCDMSPEKLPGLVKLNPLVAKEVLVKFMNSNQISKYCATLTKMELSPSSMEFVSQLTNTVQLPSEFLRQFITNCIHSCESVNDKYNQVRLIRLVCVFLHSLIKSEIVGIRDSVFEIKGFCASFGHIREAGTLFRMLQSIDKP